MTKQCQKQAEAKRDGVINLQYHFKSDIINNLDNMRISGTEPASGLGFSTRNAYVVHTRVIQKVLLCTKYYVISHVYLHLVYSNLFRKVS